MDYLELAKQLHGYNYFGVRNLTDDENYNVGDYCRDSYEWDFDHDCSTYDIDGENGETAGGTCATIIPCGWDEEEFAEEIKKAIEFNSNIYCGGRQVIIAGDSRNTNCHLDEKEIRIVDAIVIAIVE